MVHFALHQALLSFKGVFGPNWTIFGQRGTFYQLRVVFIVRWTNGNHALLGCWVEHGSFRRTGTDISFLVIGNVDLTLLMATLRGEVVVFIDLAFLFDLGTLDKHFIPLSALGTLRPPTFASNIVISWQLRSTLTSALLFDVGMVDFAHTQTDSFLKTILLPSRTGH